MLRNIFNGICHKGGGRVLVASAVGVLAGVEHLMSSRNKSVSPRRAKQAASPVAVRRQKCFSIRRTRSELGYTYWVVQGFGSHSCFVLCDTWQEAMDEAAARLRTHAVSDRQLVPAGASNAR